MAEVCLHFLRLRLKEKIEDCFHLRPVDTYVSGNVVGHCDYCAEELVTLSNILTCYKYLFPARKSFPCAFFPTEILNHFDYQDGDNILVPELKKVPTKKNPTHSGIYPKLKVVNEVIPCEDRTLNMAFFDALGEFLSDYLEDNANYLISLEEKANENKSVIVNADDIL